jgi:hypothetical protein
VISPFFNGFSAGWVVWRFVLFDELNRIVDYLISWPASPAQPIVALVAIGSPWEFEKSSRPLTILGPFWQVRWLVVAVFDHLTRDSSPECFPVAQDFPAVSADRQ